MKIIQRTAIEMFLPYEYWSVASVYIISVAVWFSSAFALFILVVLVLFEVTTATCHHLLL